MSQTDNDDERLSPPETEMNTGNMIHVTEIERFLLTMDILMRPFIYIFILHKYSKMCL